MLVPSLLQGLPALQEGLSFIGISFSVNTASGNPYSYQLCDQFPMENIIDRNYDYVMSMDEDGCEVAARQLLLRNVEKLPRGEG